ncbi:100aa long hypothetical protein [Pyrococcus horikoshii OT3]|uniref:Uncharacterized protein n=1 Tax=Pyrococcus horikoshii (strain ATCC 700860 / DSM 12428 / JCM 9974 / NBRC 100139 / OT-3) TaxID=70601 RepID=O59428_PYRHO|nr:100aa long hypothetical protein [Pyrococcus horikoshii OT3]
MLAMLPILTHFSAASLATGPLISVPLGTPSGVTITAALSSNLTLMPSSLLYSFLCLIITALTTWCLMSGLPFLTVATTMSPTPAEANLLLVPWYSTTPMT